MVVPRFSIVIPTRERAETLRFALRTCLDQAFDDYEIIVSDNFSSPATKAVVDACGSPKVRYVRTTEPVAMSTNWEFGVSHVRGEYVLLIGDDDGLLPHALTELDRIARETGARAIRWDAAYYTWPNIALPGQGNYLRIPLGRTAGMRDGAEAIREVAAFREFYTALPMLYNAAVHRDVLAALRARAGRVFPHPVPDVYSGFAVAHAAGQFLSITAPMSVSGQSAASNGIATLFNRGRNEIDREFHALNARDGLRSEPTVPDLPVFPHVPVADTFVFAKRVLFPDLDADLDRRALVAACVTGARVSADDWSAALALVRSSLADDPALQAWFDAEFAATPYRAPAPVQLRSARPGADSEALHLDADALGVSDVAGAANLCEAVLGYRRRGLELQFGTARSEFQEKEAQVQQLHAACDQLQTQLRESSAAFWLRINGQDAQIEAHVRENKALRDRVAELNVHIRAYEFQAQRGLLSRIADRVFSRRAG
ncbi:GalNAc(5)-diNAcBac-PP-undecaprenol beta-1,3-glucosyltransferase [Gemmata sp. SH-PL17]|uniref:glycosyltransferase family 2 protein n=1 Tax=Gemmata sp. SH-PL17 TaxID=1630693 RepID=UPI00078E0D4D|nr:glycosyltransferase family 2 protein [Gemmata sp. SH-PL17]AMV28223.1 GalNAc(5)-diNAcBac-PP-undecaprenol beta-1,3-glucosyltransferase [Gemmata sp. SH-PL17]